MAATLAPCIQQKFTGNNGLPLIGGKVFTYIAGTNTKLATYADSTGNVPNPNPIILDANGEADIWLSAGLYKFIVKDANDNIIKTKEPINGVGSGGGGGESGVIRALNAGRWFAPPGTGAIKDYENGFEVFKFSFEAEQELTRIVTVPFDYQGGPIYINLALYSPSTANAFRIELETTLVNPNDAASSEVNQYSEQIAIQLGLPADKTNIVQLFLTPTGKINGVTVQPLATLKLKFKRVNTLPDQEGPDDIDDVRLIDNRDEVVTT